MNKIKGTESGGPMFLTKREYNACVRALGKFVVVVVVCGGGGGRCLIWFGLILVQKLEQTNKQTCSSHTTKQTNKQTKQKTVPESRLPSSPAHVEFLSSFFSNVFYNFDRVSVPYADGASSSPASRGARVDELACGFSLLAGGSKSDKLGLAFSLFDGDGDGKLTRRECWRFIRSFLSMVAALSDECRLVSL